MDTSELMEKMEKGFKDQRADFDKLRGEFGTLSGEFGTLSGEFGTFKSSVAVQIKDGFDQTKILIENLRRDLKIFDEDTSEDGPIPLARRVTSLEGRVTKLEKRR